MWGQLAKGVAHTAAVRRVGRLGAPVFASCRDRAAWQVGREDGGRSSARCSVHTSTAGLRSVPGGIHNTELLFGACRPGLPLRGVAGACSSGRGRSGRRGAFILHKRWHGGHTELEEELEDKKSMRQAVFVTNAGAGTNLALAAAKGVVGTWCNSPALVADAVHSLSDLASDVVTLVTVVYARKPANDKHPYGHGKIETLGALSVSALLIAAGAGIGIHAYHSLLDTLPALEAALTDAAGPGHGHAHIAAKDLASMSGLALGVAAASIFAKEALFRWTLKVGEKLHSQVLIANAWHHRSDALSSLVAFAGIGASVMGFEFLDPVAGIMVAAMIVKAGGGIGLRSLQELTDQSMDAQLLHEVSVAVEAMEEVLAPPRVRARHMGHYVLVDMEIEVDPVLSISAANHVVKQVRRRVLENWSSVTEVMIMVKAHEKHVESLESPEEDTKQETEQHFRPMGEIEQDLLSAASTVAGVQGVSHLRMHFLGGQLEVEMEIYVASAHTVKEAKRIAFQVKRAAELVPDVDDVDVHLELMGHPEDES